MLSLQKAASDKIGFGYDFSSPNIASSSTTVFVSPANYVNSKNEEAKTQIASESLDKGKFILGAPPKVEKKKARNPRIKRENNKKSQQKKLHLCHHCRASEHTHPNCYKWLATKQSNSMLLSRNQNQFPSFFAPLGDFLNAFMFLSNLNDFNSSPSPLDQRFAQRKGSSKVWKEKGSKWFSHIFSLSPYVYVLLVFFAFLFMRQSRFILCFV